MNKASRDASKPLHIRNTANIMGMSERRISIGIGGRKRFQESRKTGAEECCNLAYLETLIHQKGEVRNVVLINHHKTGTKTFPDANGTNA